MIAAILRSRTLANPSINSREFNLTVTEETGGSSSSCHHCLHQAPDRDGRRTKREQLQESMSCCGRIVFWRRATILKVRRKDVFTPTTQRARYPHTSLSGSFRFPDRSHSCL